MIIFFYYFYQSHSCFYLDVDPSITIKDLLFDNISKFSMINFEHIFSFDYYEANYKRIRNLDKIPKEQIELETNNSPFSTLDGVNLKFSKTLQSYGIKEFDVLKMETYHNLGGGCWDNIKKEKNLSIGFDVDLIERNEFYINLIHFDLNMTNFENYEYYNNFKVNVVGGFYAIDDINIFQRYLKEIDKKDIPFIVISSGSSGNKIIPICKKYPFIKEVIIFCANYGKHKHYIKDYPGYVKKVFTNIKDVHEYLKSYEEIKENVFSIIANSNMKILKWINNSNNVQLFLLMNMINVIF